MGPPVTTGVPGTMDVYLTLDAEPAAESSPPRSSECYTEPIVSRLPISAFHSFQPSPEADLVKIVLLLDFTMHGSSCANNGKDALDTPSFPSPFLTLCHQVPHFLPLLS